MELASGVSRVVAIRNSSSLLNNRLSNGIDPKFLGLRELPRKSPRVSEGSIEQAITYPNLNEGDFSMPPTPILYVLLVVLRGLDVRVGDWSMSEACLGWGFRIWRWGPDTTREGE